MLKWSLFMSRWQLRNFFAKLRNSRPIKTLIRLNHHQVIRAQRNCDVSTGPGATAMALGSVATLAGVLHTPSVLLDGMVRSMGPRGIGASIGAEALAACHLHWSVARVPLMALGLCSSTASTFGSVGHPGNAAAAYMEALAAGRRHCGIAGASVLALVMSCAQEEAALGHEPALQLLCGARLDALAACVLRLLTPSCGTAGRECMPGALRLEQTWAGVPRAVVHELSEDAGSVAAACGGALSGGASVAAEGSELALALAPSPQCSGILGHEPALQLAREPMVHSTSWRAWIIGEMRCETRPQSSARQVSPLEESALAGRGSVRPSVRVVSEPKQ